MLILLDKVVLTEVVVNYNIVGKRQTILCIVVVISIIAMSLAAYDIYQQAFFHNSNLGNQLITFKTFALFVVSLVFLSSSLFAAWSLRTKRIWEAVVKEISQDRLTGLPNQQKLLKDLKYSKHTNLAFFKCQQYNSILNTYGPAVTDDVVRQVSTVISKFEHPLMLNSYRYYIQPGVFAILEDQDTDYESIEKLTKALVMTIMATQVKVGDGEYISLNLTVGAVRQNKDAFILANMALQEAEAKKLQYYLIDQQHSDLPETYKSELILTQQLLQGIKQRQLVAYYQPIFSAQHKSIEKYECLSRLIDEKGAVLMMPNVFLPLAHRANVYYLVSKIMIKHAVSFAVQHKTTVSINLSISDINNKRTCEYLFSQLKKSGVSHLIQFELLENEVITEPRKIIEFIDKLHEFGCQVGMDDLGKGYSNIERLIKLPIDFVKIDRSIMEQVVKNHEMKNLARGIIELAHKKGLKVVAEYCSDKTVTDVAVNLGVDYLQGHYLGTFKYKCYMFRYFFSIKLSQGQTMCIIFA